MTAEQSTSVVEAVRPLRADARRNREKVLRAAQAAFTEEGKLIPLDEIARRAGVGVGTVYRHFPTKEALYEAVFLSRVTKLTSYARTLTEAGDPGDAFYTLLVHMLEEGGAKRDLIDAMAGAGIDVTATTSPGSRDLRAAIAELLTRAQAAGAVRRDISTVDVMALVAGAVIAAQRQHNDPGLPRRIHTILCDGLRAGTPSARSHPPAGRRL